jgi:hypothetical protein
VHPVLLQCVGLCRPDVLAPGLVDRGVFAGGNYPEAELLYNKAIEVKADAVLYSNRSAGVFMYMIHDSYSLDDELGRPECSSPPGPSLRSSEPPALHSQRG